MAHLHETVESEHLASAYMLTARHPDAAAVFSADDFRVLRDSLNEPFIDKQDLERYVPELTFIEVEGASHWLPEERPELVSAAIREHLTRVGARGAAARTLA
jgi:hypothetical protein